MKARLTGGLVAAALLGAGLLCPGAAAAADPTGYPYELGFEPSKLIATDDAVYAAGITDDGTGYVAAAGGDEVEVGHDLYAVKMALDPSGHALRVVTTDDDGSHYWDVDTDDMSATADGAPAAGHDVELLGSDAGGIYEVQNGASFALHVPGLGSLPLAENASAGASAATGAVEDRTWYVAGSQFDGDDGSRATLWRYDEQSGERGTPVTLGAAEDPDQVVLDLAADPADDVVYALTFRDNDDAPQSYGLNVVQDGTDAYVPLRYPAEKITLSPDGRTLYLTESDSVLAVDTDTLADTPGYVEDEDLSSVSTEDRIRALAVDPAGSVFAGLSDSVVAFSAPGAPAHLAATPDSMSTTALSASWDEGKYSWELEEGEDGLTQYAYTVRTGEGGFVKSGTTYDQVVYVDGLQPGTTYTVEVTASNGLLVSEPATDEVTTLGRYVGAPSAIAIQGNLTVGSTLSVASTGTWEAGADVTYEWYGTLPDAQSSGPVIATGPALPLTAAHLNMAIYVAVTGTKSGLATVSLVSAPNLTTRVANPPVVTPPGTTTPPAATPGKLTAPKPKITGQAKVGKTLAAKAGSWTSGTKLTYHWSANGKRIKGADKAKLKLAKSLKGKKISVEVTGTKPGYTTVTQESKQTGKVRR